MLGMEMMLRQMIGKSPEEMAALVEQGKEQLSRLVEAMSNIERNTTETLARVRAIEERMDNDGRNNGGGGDAPGVGGTEPLALPGE